MLKEGRIYDVVRSLNNKCNLFW